MLRRLPLKCSKILSNQGILLTMKSKQMMMRRKSMRRIKPCLDNKIRQMTVRGRRWGSLFYIGISRINTKQNKLERNLSHQKALYSSTQP
ncbi:hypothetical protein FGO68_gene10531 [Halteria grandinella]|uniref:Uncharacterized protein n=1 Tax=Halteria grandinella TaxID=5974 RepID=A0A8J8SX39_HALGN|nr:hypothetical protein FGO68_gene10531 [Halteria grandinella]